MENPYQTPEANPQAQQQAQPQYGNPAQHLSPQTLKKLRSNSHSIRALGYVWLILGAFSLFLVVKSTSNSPLFGLQFTKFGSILITTTGSILLMCGPAAWYRPSWGRWLCMIGCALLIANLNFIFIILGVLGIIALATGKRLFGKNRYYHKDLDREYKKRKREGYL